MEKIYELEGKFISAFNDAISDVCKGNMTLEEVLNLGFNNVEINGMKGYERRDFPEKYWNRVVVFDWWDYDPDGFITVNLKFATESEVDD